MKSNKDLYIQITSKKNLFLAYKKARKGKSKKEYVNKFCESLEGNLSQLRLELLFHIYNPKPLKTFIVRDPKTRKISKSDFRDRVVHHALINTIEPIFDKTFIYDSYANRKGKGTLAALERFDKFKRKVSRNGKINGWFNNNQVKGYCLKADIKHYFQTVDHNTLLAIIKKKIQCQRTIWLIKKILGNYSEVGKQGRGMPLGNLTSQFFANVYLNELDYFIKHELKAKYYIRYVDDFVIMHSSKEQLINWEIKINRFLKNELKIELHPDKSKIIPITKPVSFVGFRVFYNYKLLKKFNRKNIQRKLRNFSILFVENKISYDKVYEIMYGSFAYLRQADSYKFRSRLVRHITRCFPNEVSYIEINRYLKDIAE